MTKFLCVLTVLMMSVSALAQNTSDSLFPELKKRTPTSEQEQINPINNQEQESQSLFEEESAEQLKQRQINAIMAAVGNDKEVAQRLREEAENAVPKPLTKAEQGFFVFSPSDIKMVVPTIPRYQYCTSKLTLANNTDAVLKELGVILKYRNIHIPYTYNQLDINDSQTGTVSLGGEACQVLHGSPVIDIKKCDAYRLVEKDGKKQRVPLSVEECKAKVKYVKK